MVDQGDLKLLFAYGSRVLGALVCGKVLETLMLKLERFVESFEVLFSGVLERWDGDVSVFEPAYRMALAEFTKREAHQPS